MITKLTCPLCNISNIVEDWHRLIKTDDNEYIQFVCPECHFATPRHVKGFDYTSELSDTHEFDTLGFDACLKDFTKICNGIQFVDLVQRLQPKCT